MNALLNLRRLMEAPAPATHKQPECELCGASFDAGHAHVIDLDQRRLMCTCRPCFLLFTHPGAAGGRYRSVSERVLKLSDFAGSCLESLDIPVGVVFFLRVSRRRRVLAFYPSPAGATESGLPLETWDEMVAANPVLDSLEPDVEALLVCRSRERTETWIVPVDACYELIGRIRKQWKGFEGGAEAWSAIHDFLAGLHRRERSCA